MRLQKTLLNNGIKLFYHRKDDLVDLYKFENSSTVFKALTQGNDRKGCLCCLTPVGLLSLNLGSAFWVHPTTTISLHSHFCQQSFWDPYFIVSACPLMLP